MRPFASTLIIVGALFFLGGNSSRLEAGVLQTYIVVYKTTATPANVDWVIERSGGTLVQSYSQIGVVIAKSENLGFRAHLLASNSDIAGAAATDSFRTYLNDDAAAAAGDPAILIPVNRAAPGRDNLSGLQWDMDQIHAPEAHAISSGRSSVVVGHIDTGIDSTHPDLASNVDAANSVSCLGGVPDSNPSAWQDDNGHGTHTAGTIAAAQNGLGIIGVAPNTRIAAIKAANREGVFSPEAAVCAFMWAGTHRFQVVNSSYLGDPDLFNCRNDAGQWVIWEAERRAIRFAVQNGTVVVSPAGNYSQELAPSSDDPMRPEASSANAIPDACAVVPGRMPGVIGVAANGNLQLKSFYSNFGAGVTQVIAPGGDSILQRTAAARNGRVLSTWPATLASSCLRQVSDCSVSPCAQYCYLQGTSMASAHVAGVAALVMSNGVMQPETVVAIVENKADALACPANRSILAPFLSPIRNQALQVCQGDIGANSFSGRGQVNALRAVSQ